MARDTILQQFYTGKDWREFRINLILTRGCTCARCKRVFEDLSQLIGHHTPVELTPDNVHNPNISLNPDNVEIVCIDCHNQEHNRFGHNTHSVYLVYGSPLSGKTTAVRQMMRRGDLVLDMDALWQALTMCPAYDKPNNVRFNVFAIRNALLDQIRTRYGKWNDAYIIGGYPNPIEREQLMQSLGAMPIYCESTKEECLARLHQDASRRHVLKQWEGYILDWWERYAP